MPLDPNEFSINTVQLNSVIQEQDYLNRVMTNARSNRSNLQQKFKQFKDNAAAPRQMRFPLDTPKYYMVLQIAKYDRIDLFKVNFSSDTNIVLPMPTNPIVDHDSVSYSTTEIGQIQGGAMNAVAPQVKNTLTNKDGLMAGINDLADKGAQVLDNLKPNAFGQPDTNGVTGLVGEAVVGLKAGVKAALAKVLPDGIENAAYILTGYSPNQFFTVLLKGPNYKSYSFAWVLFPKNKKESDEIRRICNKIHNSKCVSTAGTGALFWKHPDIFKLSYYPNSAYLHKFKPSVLSDFQVNFSPGGSPAFYAGEENPPESVAISATFTELEYWLQGDYTDESEKGIS